MLYPRLEEHSMQYKLYECTLLNYINVATLFAFFGFGVNWRNSLATHFVLQNITHPYIGELWTLPRAQIHTSLWHLIYVSFSKKNSQTTIMDAMFTINVSVYGVMHEKNLNINVLYAKSNKPHLHKSIKNESNCTKCQTYNSNDLCGRINECHTFFLWRINQRI